MEIIFYSIHCPRCKVLEAKLQQKSINYIECNSVDIMEEKGISSVPCLSIDGEIMDFGKAIKWVNEQEVAW